MRHHKTGVPATEIKNTVNLRTAEFI